MHTKMLFHSMCDEPTQEPPVTFYSKNTIFLTCGITPGIDVYAFSDHSRRAHLSAPQELLQVIATWFRFMSHHILENQAVIIIRIT